LYLFRYLEVSAVWTPTQKFRSLASLVATEEITLLGKRRVFHLKAWKTEVVGCVPLEKLIHRTQQQLEALLLFFLDRTVEK